MKRWIQKWLGLPSFESRVNQAIIKMQLQLADLASIGVDVHFKGEPHMILIFSRLNGGQIREIPAHFDNIKDLTDCVQRLKERYGVRSVTWDLPHGFNKEWFDKA